MMEPERQWTILEQDEVKGNFDGSPNRYWRANRSSDLWIAAKDQSNCLVAGWCRNFPQDSWDIVIVVLSGRAND